MLIWLGERHEDKQAVAAAEAIDAAVAAVLKDPSNHPVDLGGRAKTKVVGTAVATALS